MVRGSVESYSGRDERVRRVNLGLLGDAEFLQMRPEDLAEPVASLLRFPHVDHAKAVRPLACDVDQKALNWPVRPGLHPVPASLCQATYDSAVFLLGEGLGP